MIGQPTLNGKPIEITDSWDKMTFAQFLRVLKLKKEDTAELISILTGIPNETVKKAKIIGFDKILYAANFMNKPAKFPEIPTKIGKFKLPLNSDGVFDIQFESLAQFEDMKQAMKEAGSDNVTDAYATYCAIYLQKLRDGEYDWSKAQIMAKELMDYKACEIIPAGSFFFVKLMSLSLGIVPNYQNGRQKQGKKTGKRSRKSSGRMPRSTARHGR